jgi:hypothetical protein
MSAMLLSRETAPSKRGPLADWALAFKKAISRFRLPGTCPPLAVSGTSILDNRSLRALTRDLNSSSDPHGSESWTIAVALGSRSRQWLHRRRSLLNH